MKVKIKTKVSPLYRKWEHGPWLVQATLLSLGLSLYTKTLYFLLFSRLLRFFYKGGVILDQ
jgi:hypothetical protein